MYFAHIPFLQVLGGKRTGACPALSGEPGIVGEEDQTHVSSPPDR